MVLNKYADVRSKTAGFNFLNTFVLWLAIWQYVRQYMEVCKLQVRMKVASLWVISYNLHVSIDIGRWAHFNVKLHFLCISVVNADTGKKSAQRVMNFFTNDISNIESIHNPENNSRGKDSLEASNSGWVYLWAESIQLSPYNVLVCLGLPVFS